MRTCVGEAVTVSNEIPMGVAVAKVEVGVRFGATVAVGEAEALLACVVAIDVDVGSGDGVALGSAVAVASVVGGKGGGARGCCPRLGNRNC